MSAGEVDVLLVKRWYLRLLGWLVLPFQRALDVRTLGIDRRVLRVEVELDWQRAACAPMLLTIERAASPRHYHRLIDDLALSSRAAKPGDKRISSTDSPSSVASEAALRRLLMNAPGQARATRLRFAAGA